MLPSMSHWTQGLKLMLMLPLLLQCGDPTSPSQAPAPYSYDYRRLPQRVGILDLRSYERGPFLADKHEDALVVAAERKVQVIDLTIRAAPALLNEWEWSSTITGIAMSAELIYVLDKTGLHIISRERSTQAPMSFVSFPVDEIPVGVYSDEACFVAVTSETESFVYFIDVGNPAQPIARSRVKVPGPVTEFECHGNMLVVGTEAGAVLMDVAQLDQVEILSTLNKGRHITVANGFAYVNGVGEVNSSGITTLDIRDPRNPYELGSIFGSGVIGPLTIQAGRLFIRSSEQVDVIDVLNRKKLTHTGAWSMEGRGPLFMENGMLWSLGEDLSVYEVGDDIEPDKIADQIHWGLSWRDAQIDSGRLYAERGGELYAFNTNDPTLSTEGMQFPVAADRDFLVRGSRVYTWRVDIPQILIRNLHTVAVQKSIDLTKDLLHPEDRIWSVFIADGFLHVVLKNWTRTQFELLIIDIGQLRTPRIAGRLVVEGNPFANLVAGLLTKETLLIASDNGQGEGIVDFLDVKNPWQPQHLSRLTEIPRPSGAITESRGFLYLGTNNGLATIDMRDRHQSQVVLLADDRSTAKALVVIRRVLYSMNSNETVLYDTTNPGRPHEIATWLLRNGYNSHLLSDGQVLFSLISGRIIVTPLHVSQ